MPIRGNKWTRRIVIWLSILTLITLFIVNIAGFIDTETGSAYGCGHQWPLCNGNVIPAKWGIHTIIEFAHRGIVGVATVLLLVLSALAWWVYGRWTEVKALILLSVGFVFLEAFLGAMGVIFSDPPAVLATHFGVSLVAFDGVFLLLVVLRQIERKARLNQTTMTLRPPVERKFRRWVWISIAYIYLAMYFGAYVSSTGDGGFFRGWPFPTESYAQAHAALFVDIIHRSFALGLVILMTYLAVRSYKLRHTRRDLWIGSLWSVVFVLMQALSGALLIYTHLSMTAFLLHVSIITLLFSTLGYLALQTLGEPARTAKQSLERMKSGSQFEARS